MNIEKEISLIKSFNIPEINEAMRFVDSALYKGDRYKENFEKMVTAYKNMLSQIHKDKEIELNKTYWVTEWSWSPMCDGRYVYEETIREHAVINGVDCYFTNKNNRVYFKEYIYTDKEEAERVCDWQNSFGYDYDEFISREADIRPFIEFVAYHWKLKKGIKNDK